MDFTQALTYTEGTLSFTPLISITIAIVALFAGKGLNLHFQVLRNFNIPEPVVGGLLFSFIFALSYFIFGVTIEFDLSFRDLMLVYFFTTIGLQSSVKDLLKGGKPLVILLTATIIYMMIQNSVGMSISALFGAEPAAGMLGGTVSLIGGHGTSIAWAPTFAEKYGIENAMEIGIACATFGLILASLMGGPVAKYLVNKYDLKPEEKGDLAVGVSHEEKTVTLDYSSFLHAVYSIHVSIIIGYVINVLFQTAGLNLPLFVTCLFAGIFISSMIIPWYSKIFYWMDWDGRKTAIPLIADISLGIFLAMSLMSIQLWVIIDLAGPILAVLIAQFVIAALITIFIVFKLMGSNYDAAVISAGFGGIALGSTATAMANMTAVAKNYGPSPMAFIVVPLIGAFFIDLVNVVMIQSLLSYF